MLKFRSLLEVTFLLHRKQILQKISTKFLQVNKNRVGNLYVKYEIKNKKISNSTNLAKK